MPWTICRMARPPTTVRSSSSSGSSEIEYKLSLINTGKQFHWPTKLYSRVAFTALLFCKYNLVHVRQQLAVVVHVAYPISTDHGILGMCASSSPAWCWSCCWSGGWIVTISIIGAWTTKDQLVITIPESFWSIKGIEEFCSDGFTSVEEHIILVFTILGEVWNGTYYDSLCCW